MEIAKNQNSFQFFAPPLLGFFLAKNYDDVESGYSQTWFGVLSYLTNFGFLLKNSNSYSLSVDKFIATWGQNFSQVTCDTNFNVPGILIYICT